MKTRNNEDFVSVYNSSLGKTELTKGKTAGSKGIMRLKFSSDLDIQLAPRSGAARERDVRNVFPPFDTQQ